MSVLKGALTVLAGAAAVSAYKVARETKRSDPGIALGALGISALAGSYAAHKAVEEVEEFRRKVKGYKR